MARLIAAAGAGARWARQLFLERQDPAYQCLDLVVGHLWIRRHRNLAPDSGAARLDLLRKLRLRAGIALILGGDVDVGRTDDFLVYAVTRRAAVFLHQRLARL